MGMDFDITSNLEAVPEWIDDHKQKIVAQAARSAINKTLISARKVSVKIIGRYYKLKPSGLSKRDVKNLIIKKNARGGSIGSIKGELIYRGAPIPLIKFVSGHKNIIKQKGIKVRKRRKLKVEIRPGKKIHLKGAFIQKAKSKQVFKTRSSGGFSRQAAPGIGEVMQKPMMQKAIMKHVERTFPKIFDNQISWRLARHADKLNRSRMKRLSSRL